MPSIARTAVLSVLALTAVTSAGLGLSGRMTAPASAAASTYKVDPVHSSNVFKIRHNNVANFYGRFKETTGSINWDDAEPAASSLKIEIPVASVDTGAPNRDNHLKSPDFFNAAQFPTLSFVSTSVSRGEGDTYKVSGDLTLHGVTKPIAVDLLKTGSGKSQRGGELIGFETTFRLKRTDFGMDYGVDSNTLGDDVQVIVSLEAVKQ